MLDLPREQTTTEILLRQSLDAVAKLLALANIENRVLRDRIGKPVPPYAEQGPYLTAPKGEL